MSAIEKAREAYLHHCVAWGGFDSVDEARGWAERSKTFHEQVEAHADLLCDFARAALAELEASEGEGDLKQIREKCEQYWNAPALGAAEMHAILEFIHARTPEPEEPASEKIGGESRMADPHSKEPAPPPGVYHKFKVERTDGRSAPGEKHHGCRYWVLDIDHDDSALPALRAYADACREAYPKLASDLDDICEATPCGCRSVGECPHLSAGTPGEILEEKMGAHASEEPAPPGDLEEVAKVLDGISRGHPSVRGTVDAAESAAKLRAHRCGGGRFDRWRNIAKHLDAERDSLREELAEAEKDRRQLQDIILGLKESWNEACELRDNWRRDALADRELAKEARAELAEARNTLNEHCCGCEVDPTADHPLSQCEYHEKIVEELAECKTRNEFADKLFDRVVISGGAGRWTIGEMHDWCCDYKDHKNGYPAGFILKHGHARCTHMTAFSSDESARDANDPRVIELERQLAEMRQDRDTWMSFAGERDVRWTAALGKIRDELAEAKVDLEAARAPSKTWTAGAIADAMREYCDDQETKTGGWPPIFDIWIPRIRALCRPGLTEE